MVKQKIIISDVNHGRYKFKFDTISATCIVGDRLNRRYVIERDKSRFFPFQSVSEEAKIAYTKAGINPIEYFHVIHANFPDKFDIIFDIKQDHEIVYELKLRK